VKVLSVSADSATLSYRHTVLRALGHKVVSVSSDYYPISECLKPDLDAVLLCNSISPPVLESLKQQVRTHCPSATVLDVYSDGSDCPQLGKRLRATVASA
jgi:hypothetical protein